MLKRSKTALASAADHLLARLREWWRNYNELKGLIGRELERIAADFGMSTRDFKELVNFKELVTRGPHAADLLYQRMTASANDCAWYYKIGCRAHFSGLDAEARRELCILLREGCLQEGSRQSVR